MPDGQRGRGSWGVRVLEGAAWASEQARTGERGRGSARPGNAGARGLGTRECAAGRLDEAARADEDGGELQEAALAGQRQGLRSLHVEEHHLPLLGGRHWFRQATRWWFLGDGALFVCFLLEGMEERRDG